jgi:hypothetical protein
LRRPPKVQVDENQRDKDGAGRRHNQGEKLSGVKDFDYVLHVCPTVEPEYNGQKAVEPLLVD